MNETHDDNLDRVWDINEKVGVTMRAPNYRPALTRRLERRMTIEQRGSKRGPRVSGSNNSKRPSKPKITFVPAHHVSFALNRSRSWNRHETVIEGRLPKRKNFVNRKLWFDRLKRVVAGKLAPRTLRDCSRQPSL